MEGSIRMIFNRKKEETKPKEEDNFTGWGCCGIIKDGKQHQNFEIEQFRDKLQQGE